MLNKSLKNLKILFVLFTCLFSLSGCCDCDSGLIYAVSGGETAVQEMCSTKSLNQDFNQWCKHYGIVPMMQLPVKYPDNPGAVLKQYSYISRTGKRLLPGANGYGMEKYVDMNNPTPEQWRYSIFRWERQRAKEDLVKYNKMRWLFCWKYLNEIYDSLPLDGSYTAYFIYAYKGYSEPYSPRGDNYIRVIVDPDMKIVAVSDPIAYGSKGKDLKRMEKLGVFIF